MKVIDEFEYQAERFVMSQKSSQTTIAVNFQITSYEKSENFNILIG